MVSSINKSGIGAECIDAKFLCLFNITIILISHNKHKSFSLITTHTFQKEIYFFPDMFFNLLYYKY